MSNENNTKKIISEHEETKNMLDILRNSNKAKMKATFLNEDTSIFDKAVDTEDTEATEMEADQSIDTDEITGNAEDNGVGEGEEAVKVSGADLADEQQKITDIEPTIDITSFVVYPESKNAVMTGDIPGLSGAHFEFILTDHDGCNLTTNSMQMDEKTIKILAQLQGYYTNWSKDWSTKIRKEYSSGNIKTTGTFDNMQ